MISIEHSQDGRIITLRLNRPERRNALNKSLVLELTRVISSLNQDDYVRVILITGEGSVFSAGADLAALSRMADASEEENLEDSRALATLFMTIRSSTKVVMAWVNGHAIAGGSGLATACDLSFAAASAKFGFSEVLIGFVPALVSVLLRSRLSETRIRDLLLTGRLFKAEEAEEMGLITRSIPDEDLERVVLKTAESIARNTSPEAIARTKALLSTSVGPSFEVAMEKAVRANAAARQSLDCQSGVRAFLEKKPAPWVTAWDNDHSGPA